jgi:diaminohydroxyphosphoribosylaminopyrimidine deaminase / 5-amino-6-(5-phosphoribosylamino)uracil reductase
MAARANPESDRRWMRVALRLAGEALGITSPNPAVGCVIVRDGRTLGAGATAAGGRPHAETIALARAGARARGAAAYVTLEPCAHQGQTPACARALIDAGVRRVVVGCVDPYPAVRGRGIAMLRRAGIAVTAGVLEAECRRLNEGFISRVTRRRPFVTLKLAMSLDGRIAAASGDSRWISSPPARAMVHQWRREADAVMVGAGTVCVDNPRLTCRIRGGRDPARVIVDARLKVPPAAQVFHLRSHAPSILVTTTANLARARRRYRGAPIEVIAAPAAHGELALAALMREFGRRGWSKVLIEGGAHLAGAALRAGIVDRIAIFVAPKLVGAGLSAIEGLRSRTIRDAIGLKNLTARQIGVDWLLEADVR